MTAAAFDTACGVGRIGIAMLALVSCGGRIDPSPGGGDTDGEIPREQFVSSVSAAITNSVQQCCGRAGASVYVDYEQRVQAYWQSIVDHATEIHAQYNAAQAGHCAAELRREWERCADRKSFTSAIDDTCATVFSAPSPRQLEGQACKASMDCAQNGDQPIVCHNQASDQALNGTCVVHMISAVGGICGGVTDSVLANCRAPLVCGPDQRCHEPFTLGAPCDRLGGDTCSAGNVCDLLALPHCQKALPLGATCAAETDCENFSCRDRVCRVVPAFSLSLVCN